MCKGLKKIYRAKVSSYFIKKVLLLPEFVKRGTDMPFKLLYDVLHYPELRKHFENCIDYKEWHYPYKHIPPILPH